uniref:RING-type domain-containing protein n=1 Tax=Calidris pygmaea TaxID=425635 RepID=A0A8C3KDB2_9CHAR
MIPLARTPVEMLQDESCCSICLGIFQDPVSIHCGHSFCRSCITEAWEGLTTNFSCPQCRETGDQKTLHEERLICVVCDKSKVHSDHSVVPVEEAAQECKEIVRTYRKMHELLEKQESSLLAQLEQLDTEIRKAHEEILQRLLEETTRLGTLIGEMERTYQQPD